VLELERDRGCLLLRRPAAAAAATAALAATARGLCQAPVTTRAAVAADRSVRCAALLPAVCVCQDSESQCTLVTAGTHNSCVKQRQCVVQGGA
jgi:hypothetical protein